MTKLIQEALLPGTDAIKRGELEMVPYRGKILVRMKNLAGVPIFRETFDDLDLAHAAFLKCLTRLEEECGMAKRAGSFGL